MCRRTVAPMVGGLVLGSVLGTSGPVGGESAVPSHDIAVVERPTTHAVIDIGDAGDTIGDLLAFGNDLYDATR